MRQRMKGKSVFWWDYSTQTHIDQHTHLDLGIAAAKKKKKKKFDKNFWAKQNYVLNVDFRVYHV